MSSQILIDGQLRDILRHHQLPTGTIPLFTPVAALCVKQVDEECAFIRESPLQPSAIIKTGFADECGVKAGMFLIWRLRYCLPTINKACQHNALAALTSRGFGLEHWARGDYDMANYEADCEMHDANFEAMFTRCFHILYKIREPTCCTLPEPLTPDLWLKRYGGGPRLRLVQDANDSLYTTTLRYNSFVKQELIPNYKEEYKKIDPRLISVPPAWFRKAIGPHGHFFGKMLAAAWCKHNWVVYASGLNPEDLGEVIHIFLDRGFGVIVSGDDILIYYNGKWIWYDAARFDMHTRARAIVIIRKWQFWGLDPYYPVPTLLRKFILNNSVRKYYSDRYGNTAKGFGTRASGDYDTSSGNSPIEVLPAIDAIENFKREPIAEDWLSIGYVVEGGSSPRLEDADFLSRNFILDGDNCWFACVKAGRIISKTGWSKHHYSKRKNIHGYIRGLLLGLRNDLLSHPLLGGFMKLLLFIDDVKPIFTSSIIEQEYELHATRVHPIGPQTWECLKWRYSLSYRVLKELKDEIDSVHLGCEFKHTAWKRVIEIDL